MVLSLISLATYSDKLQGKATAKAKGNTLPLSRKRKAQLYWPQDVRQQPSPTRSRRLCQFQSCQAAIFVFYHCTLKLK